LTTVNLFFKYLVMFMFVLTTKSDSYVLESMKNGYDQEEKLFFCQL
jgi:hypothetical protein